MLVIISIQLAIITVIVAIIAVISWKRRQESNRDRALASSLRYRPKNENYSVNLSVANE